MKNISPLFWIVFIGILIILSCKKEPSSYRLAAIAGPDQVITFPTDSILLDGSSSRFPDGTISNWLWTKISGPPGSYNIVNPTAAKTVVKNLNAGIYQFELKVADAGALFSKDTIQVTVKPPFLCDNSNRPQINAQLIPVGTLSQARTHMAVASAGNKILFAGGLSASGYSSRVDIYDLTTQSWSTAELCVGRVSMAAVASGNRMFFGGGEFSDGFVGVDSVDIYDVSANTWTVAHLSVQGYGLAAAAVGDKVFFVGDSRRGVDIYDMNLQTWSTALLSEGREGITAVTANNKIFFAGGGWNRVTDKVDIYDNATNSWSTSSLIEPKSRHAGIAVADKIYWAGGYSTYGQSCVVEIKDLNTGNSSIQFLFKPGYWWPDEGQNAVVKDNKIIFYRRPNGTTDRDKFDIYDIATNTWSIGILPQPIPNSASIISVNNTIYIAGGSVNGILSNQVWKLEF